MTFTLAQIAEVLRVECPAHGRITGFSVDTRTLQPGDLYFALRGPAHDGNDYIEQALENGAVGVVANRAAVGPVFVVPDTLAALQRLAAWARARWNGDVVGITGSAGKTSTKDVVAALLSTRWLVGKTQGNFNNHVGLPLSILRLADDAELAVLELGMNHAGEIRDLAKIAQPRVGVVTNVGTAHIEFFESIDGIAAAKRELIESLPHDGVAVLNADDARVAAFAAKHSGKSITYGLSDDAMVRATGVRFFNEGTNFRVDDVPFETRLIGRHNVLNILAGIVVAGLYGISARQLQEPVSELVPGPMRGERLWRDGLLILNDCYNSNPDAAKSMLGVLRDTQAMRRIAVLGEMLELGHWSETLHREVGKYVVGSGVDVLVGIRGAAKSMVDAAIAAGMPASAAFFFNEPSEAGAYLRTIAREGDAILFKGSRGSRVEKALQAFLPAARESAATTQAYS